MDEQTYNEIKSKVDDSLSYELRSIKEELMRISRSQDDIVNFLDYMARQIRTL